jgi:hypothetical protein
LAHAGTTITLPSVVAQAIAAIALGLLGASGVAKLVDPEPTTGAMNAARLPSSNTLSRLLGLAEVVGTIVALVTAGTSVLLAVGLYAAFAAFTLAAVVFRLPLQSCGCFGREDTPPTILHVAFNFIATSALLFLFFTGSAPIDWALPALDLALYLGFTVMGVYATYLLMTRLPQVLELAGET